MPRRRRRRHTPPELRTRGRTSGEPTGQVRQPFAVRLAIKPIAVVTVHSGPAGAGARGRRGPLAPVRTPEPDRSGGDRGDALAVKCGAVAERGAARWLGAGSSA